MRGIAEVAHEVKGKKGGAKKYFYVSYIVFLLIAMFDMGSPIPTQRRRLLQR